MSYAKLRNSLLAARDARQLALEKGLAAGHEATLMLCLNIPGASKTPPGASGLFGWGERMLCTALPQLLMMEQQTDLLGPWALYAAESDAQTVKEATLTVESAHPAARLLDIDVYNRDIMPIDRASLDLPQRPCLVCQAPARDCIRLGRHHPEELQRRVHDLLAPFRS